MHLHGLARPLAPVAIAAAAASMVLAGCSHDRSASADPASSASSSAGSSAGSSDSATASASSSAATPTRTATTASASAAPTSAAPTLRDRLLAAHDLPALEPAHTWTEQATLTREPSRPTGTCQRFGLTSIGAGQVAVRRFRTVRPIDQERAEELVATFPDERTAQRAYAVLTSWHARCAATLKHYHRADVGEVQDVAVPGGRGAWYLLVYGPVPDDMDAGFFDAQGMTLVGRRIAVLTLVQVGQNYDYDPGSEPMVAALRTAASRLR